MEMITTATKSLTELQQLIQKKIDGYCRVNGEKPLFEPVNYLIQLPGKRMRPALCLMSANLFTDEIDSIGTHAQNPSYFTHFDRFIGPIL